MRARFCFVVALCVSQVSTHIILFSRRGRSDTHTQLRTFFACLVAASVMMVIIMRQLFFMITSRDGGGWARVCLMADADWGWRALAGASFRSSLAAPIPKSCARRRSLSERSGSGGKRLVGGPLIRVCRFHFSAVGVCVN